MIRELQKADINKVADIWLDTNVVLFLNNIGKIILN